LLEGCRCLYGNSNSEKGTGTEAGATKTVTRDLKMGLPAGALLQGPHREDGETLKKGSEVKRKRKSIMRGKPERLTWSDESVRRVLASRFLGRRKPVSSASTDADDS
jgi:hypothetical protein